MADFADLPIERGATGSFRSVLCRRRIRRLNGSPRVGQESSGALPAQCGMRVGRFVVRRPPVVHHRRIRCRDQVGPGLEGLVVWVQGEWRDGVRGRR